MGRRGYWRMLPRGDGPQAFASQALRAAPHFRDCRGPLMDRDRVILLGQLRRKEAAATYCRLMKEIFWISESLGKKCVFEFRLRDINTKFWNRDDEPSGIFYCGYRMVSFGKESSQRLCYTTNHNGKKVCKSPIYLFTHSFIQGFIWESITCQLLC